MAQTAVYLLLMVMQRPSPGLQAVLNHLFQSMLDERGVYNHLTEMSGLEWLVSIKLIERFLAMPILLRNGGLYTRNLNSRWTTIITVVV